MLTVAGCVLLRRLSIFAGSFTFEAIEYICAPLPTSILDVHSHLVEKSLVMVEREGDEVYYRLLDTIREYAWEKLLAAEEEMQLRANHLDFYLHKAEVAASQFFSTGQESWLAPFERAHNNVRVALLWALEQGKRSEALRLVGAMGQFWWMRGYWSEGRQWLEQTLALGLEKGSSPDSSAAMRGWYAEALLQAGISAWCQCDFVAAHVLLEKSITFYREIDNWDRHSYALALLAAVTFEQGEYTTARAIYEELLPLTRESRNKQYIGVLLTGLGNVAMNLGEYAVAQTHLRESQILLHELEHESDLAHTLNALGNVANLQGDYYAAHRRYEESLALRRKLGDKRGIAATLGDVANVTAKEGDFVMAQVFYAESLTLFRELGNQRGMISALSGLARIHQVQGRPQLTVKLLSAVEVLLQALGVRIDEPEYSDKQHALALLRIQLDVTNFDTVWKEGQSLTLEQAIVLAI
jgi:tetratricopeptide (TPR) repeat protein